jgi:hypothetical protein
MDLQNHHGDEHIILDTNIDLDMEIGTDLDETKIYDPTLKIGSN